MQCIVVRETKT